jgi:D-aminopeptidase
MIRVSAARVLGMVAGAATLLSATPAYSQAPRPMKKLFISADLEGITGVIQPAQLGPAGFEYAIELEVGFKFTPDAERAAYIPGLARVDAHVVRGTFADMLTITKLMQVLTSLEPIQ